ncbi:thiamine-phosphate kinase [Moraxella nasovis]|uniref:thiamine-phosphate kinase n=1 Tax=Moraxella nasovis TaxID=2904121 RepID=UPI001F6153FC|nr:thiamine-phosphate kinase [Moraxella nasovis]UNU72643.1 thiamine-phosphate kinase [Moraxella nasovis]
MSEFSLIYTHFKNATCSHPNTVLGIGDDGALSRVPDDCELVSCLDTLVAGRHFVQKTCPHAVAFKSVAVNLSDLAAMGATPYAVLVGLSLPKQMANDEFCRQFANGLADICTPFGVELIGGDTTSSPVLTVSVTALGFVPTGQAITRDGAKVSDVICVSGEIGSASVALHQILDTPNKNNHDKDGHATPNSLDNLSNELMTALQYPMPRLHLGQALRGFASAMIDISDGLGQDLGHILTASKVGAILHLEKIPANPLLQKLPNAQKWQHQLNGGDDYELCFTISPDKLALFEQHYPDFTVYPIGEIVADKGLILTYQGQTLDFNIKGWEHF